MSGTMMQIQSGIVSCMKRAGADIQWAYNMDDGLAAWNAGIAEGKRLHLQVAGDSIGYGQWANWPIADNGFIGKLAAKLDAMYGNGDTGIVKVDDPRWTYTGSWSGVFGSNGGYQGLGKDATKAGDSASITVYGSQIDVFWQGNSVYARPFTVVIDGGAPVTLGGPLYDGFQFHRFTNLGLNNHSFVLTATEDSAISVRFQGIDVREGAGGFTHLNFSISGQIVPSSIPVYINGLGTSFSPYTPIPECPLTIIEFTSNDYGSQTAVPTYKSRLNSIVARARRASQSVLMLVVNWQKQTKAIPQSEYDNAAKEVASDNNCALISMADRWGEVSRDMSVDLGFSIEEDSVRHPNQAGHDDYFAAIGRYI